MPWAHTALHTPRPWSAVSLTGDDFVAQYTAMVGQGKPFATRAP